MAVVKEPVRDEVERSTEELEMLRARQQNLLALIAELLETNEKLRMKVARLEELGGTPDEAVLRSNTMSG